MITRRKLFGLLAGLPFVKALPELPVWAGVDLATPDPRGEPARWMDVGRYGDCVVYHMPNAILVKGSVIHEEDLEKAIAEAVRKSIKHGSRA